MKPIAMYCGCCLAVEGRACKGNSGNVMPHQVHMFRVLSAALANDTALSNPRALAWATPLFSPCIRARANPHGLPFSAAVKHR